MMRWRFIHVALAAALVACQAPANAGTPCSSARDCAAPLVCGLGRCRSACAANRDCASDARCLLDANGVGSCSLEIDQRCGSGGVACAVGLSCVGDQCANACAASSDCPSDGVCVIAYGTTARICVRQGDDAGVALLPDGAPAVDSGGARDAHSELDAAVIDAGTADAASVDGAMIDAPTADAASTDAQLVDVPSNDAPPIDAGPFGCGSAGGPCCGWRIPGRCAPRHLCNSLPTPSVCSPCGAAGTDCCADDAGPCAAGYACSSGVCTPTVDAGCGALGSLSCSTAPPCVAGAVEDPQLLCVPCGGAGERCCSGNACDDASLTCQDGYCVTCGAYDGICCGGACPGVLDVCMTGTPALCEPSTTCGESGMPCCAGGICDWNRYLECVGGTCETCDAVGRPCCDGTICINATIPDTQYVQCMSGSCANCGGHLQPCCAGDPQVPACQPGQYCSAGTCVACSAGNGQPCCPGGACRSGYACDPTTHCAQCGGQAQLCCPGLAPCPMSTMHMCNIGNDRCI